MTPSIYVSGDKAIYGLGIWGRGGVDNHHYCDGEVNNRGAARGGGWFQQNHLFNRCPNLQGNSCDEWYPVGWMTHRGRGNQECGNFAWIR